MAKFHGRLQSFTFSAVAVGGLQDGSATYERAELDSTDHDDASRTYIPGRLSATIELTLKADSGDAGQAALRDNLFNNTGPEAFDYRDGDGRKVTGSAFVTSWNPSGPNDDVAAISCTLRVTGDVTEATV